MTAHDKTSDERVMTAERLADFAAAWRRKDVEALMTFMADDPEFRASIGPEPGSTWRGRDEVRRGFEVILAHDDAGEGHAGVTIIDGPQGATTWVLVGRDASGVETRVYGCDIYEFEGDRIKLKDAYRKVSVDLEAGGV